MRPHLRAVLIAASLALSNRADAQTSGYVEHKTAEGQAVSFDDDPMSGLTGNPIGAQLWGFHPAKRCDLMRPRVNFVPELLKTVEKM